MKYRIEVSEEQLRVIGLAVDEYMRLRMGQFDDLAEDLAYDGIPPRQSSHWKVHLRYRPSKEVQQHQKFV